MVEDGNAETVNCHHNRVREDVVVEIGKGGAQSVILFLSDPGGNKEEIRNRAMSGLRACWAVVGQERTEKSGWGLEGTIIVIYIHTRAHNGWLMGKQAGQSGGREGGVWALLLNTEQRIRDKRWQSGETRKYHSPFLTASRCQKSARMFLRLLPL